MVIFGALFLLEDKTNLLRLKIHYHYLECGAIYQMGKSKYLSYRYKIPTLFKQIQ